MAKRRGGVDAGDRWRVSEKVRWCRVTQGRHSSKMSYISMGVPVDRTRDALTMILETATSTGLLRQINERTFVDLKGTAPSREKVVGGKTEEDDDSAAASGALPKPSAEQIVQPTAANIDAKIARARKVFITHGKNRALIEPTLLKLFEVWGFGSICISSLSQTGFVSRCWARLWRKCGLVGPQSFMSRTSVP